MTYTQRSRSSNKKKREKIVFSVNLRIVGLPDPAAVVFERGRAVRLVHLSCRRRFGEEKSVASGAKKRHLRRLDIRTVDVQSLSAHKN